MILSFCPECQRPLPDSATLCPFCGYALAEFLGLPELRSFASFHLNVRRFRRMGLALLLGSTVIFFALHMIGDDYLRGDALQGEAIAAFIIYLVTLLVLGGVHLIWWTFAANLQDLDKRLFERDGTQQRKLVIRRAAGFLLLALCWVHLSFWGMGIALICSSANQSALADFVTNCDGWLLVIAALLASIALFYVLHLLIGLSVTALWRLLVGLPVSGNRVQLVQYWRQIHWTSRAVSLLLLLVMPLLLTFIGHFWEYASEGGVFLLLLLFFCGFFSGTILGWKFDHEEARQALSVLPAIVIEPEVLRN